MMIQQASTTGLRHVRMYAYFFGVCMILDMHTLTCILIFSLRFFKVFKICLILIILYYLKTYCYIFDLNLFVLEKPYFSIFHTSYLINASPYLRARANLGCQLKISLNSYVCVLHFHYEILKKPYMRTSVGSSGREFVLIILFQFYGSRAGLF